MAARKSSGNWAKEIKAKSLVESSITLIDVDGSPELIAVGHRAVLRARRGDKELTSLPIEGLHAACHFASRVASSKQGALSLVFGGSDQTRLVLVDRDAKILGQLHDPRLASAMNVAISPSGDEIVVVTDTSTGSERVPAQIHRISARSLAEGGGLELLAECPFRPAIAFDDDGRLCWLQSKELATWVDGRVEVVKLATEIDRAALPGATSSTTCGFQSPADLHVSGERCVAREDLLGGSYFVFDRGGAMIRTFSGLCLDRLALIDGGRKLTSTAAPAKDRTGSADWVPWADPRMREAYVGWFDTDSGDILGLVERGKGSTRGFAANDEVVIVASDLRSEGKRIEAFNVG